MCKTERGSCTYDGFSLISSFCLVLITVHGWEGDGTLWCVESDLENSRKTGNFIDKLHHLSLVKFGFPSSFTLHPFFKGPFPKIFKFYLSSYSIPKFFNFFHSKIKLDKKIQFSTYIILKGFFSATNSKDLAN